MKCEVCNKEYQSEDFFKVKGICKECFDTLPETQRKLAEKRIAELRENDKNKRQSINFAKITLIAAGFLLVGIIIISLGGMWILYVLGVSVVAAILYAIYEGLIEILTASIVILGGLLAQYLTNENIFPWYISILICGVIVGFLITPFVIIIDVKKLKSKK